MSEVTDTADEIPAFPTGKPHVSFSEVKCWKECPWRHKKRYIDKIDLSTPSPYLDFGKIVHAACEAFLKTRAMDVEGTLAALRSSWQENSHEDVDVWCEHARLILENVPTFLETEYPSWECAGAEVPLYEPNDQLSIHFKGFIDAILKVKDRHGKDKYVIIDWKTSQAWGWRQDKKRDPDIQAQLILYKHYWMTKNNLKSADVSCAFVLLKKGAKAGKTCQVVTVGSGPTAVEKSRKMVRNMVTAVRRGAFIKNRFSCTYCEYKDTEHCP